VLSDPIVALATPPGRSALAVVRLSGAGALDVAARVIRPFLADPARTAHLAEFVGPDGTAVDRGLYLVFRAPASYTGEDAVECFCHGGLVTPARLVAALEAAGARPAAPGEFTRRAVLNGRMDLVQAEAVGDLIAADAPTQARAALARLEGGLSRRLAALREELVTLLALLAYDIDFPGEDDGPVDAAEPRVRLAAVRARVARLLATAPAGARLREGALVVLAGPPNAGKSSLFNALLGRDRAIVTEIPGTTRDAIEAHAALDGWPVRLVDTAGVRDAEDRIERMGVEVSRRWLDAADLVLWCEEGEGTPAPAPEIPADRVLPISTKSDLHDPTHPFLRGPPRHLRVSAVNGEGLGELREAIVARLYGDGTIPADLDGLLVNERHRAALARAAGALEQAAPHLEPGGDTVLAAHEVQEAVAALDALVGAVDVEEVLGAVFAGFCVGK
jgi:tRNA modification GTPase